MTVKTTSQRSLLCARKSTGKPCTSENNTTFRRSHKQAQPCRRVAFLPVHVTGTTGRKVTVWGVDLCRGSRGGGQNFCLLGSLENGGIELGFLQAFAVIRSCCRHRLALHLRTKRIGIRKPQHLSACVAALWLQCCKYIQLNSMSDISRLKLKKELRLTCESVIGPASYRPSPLPPLSSSACCCCCNCL